MRPTLQDGRIIIDCVALCLNSRTLRIIFVSFFFNLLDKSSNSIHLSNKVRTAPEILTPKTASPHPYAMLISLCAKVSREGITTSAVCQYKSIICILLRSPE